MTGLDHSCSLHPKIDHHSFNRVLKLRTMRASERKMNKQINNNISIKIDTHTHSHVHTNKPRERNVARKKHNEQSKQTSKKWK